MNNKDQKYDIILKLLLVGNSGVGKTHFLERLKHNTFNPVCSSTCGISSEEKYIKIDGKTIKAVVLDSSGDKKFLPVVSSYYSYAHGILLFYDICNQKSFNDLNKWMNDFRKSTKNIPVVLIGNKCDLEGHRQVPHADSRAYAEMNGLTLIETSAYHGMHIKGAFERIICEVLLQKSAQNSVLDISLILLGNPFVGKTNLIIRYVRNIFKTNLDSTIGLFFETKTVQIKNKTIKAQIWDTSGQEKYDSITQNHYRDALGALVVYDITDYESFKGAKRWVHKVRFETGEDTVIIFVGNKLDLPRAVRKREVELFARQQKLLFIETSAMKSTNVEQAFKVLLTKILDNLPLDHLESLKQEMEVVKLDEEMKEKKGCCLMS